MRLFKTILIVSIAALLLLGSASLMQKFELELQIHQNSFINGLANHQLFALIISILMMFLFIRLNPESKKLLTIGNLDSIAIKEKWLGINGKTSWLANGLQLLLIISVATGVFMFLGVKQDNSLNNFQWWFVPFALLFAFTNSFSEEIIFRFGLIAGLQNYYPKITIQIVSAILFGLPHYFGNPSGVIGVLMAGVLGYILCKATIETKGLSIAWMIHFVQDIIIFMAIIMINIEQ